jgi:hypothetical protein
MVDTSGVQQTTTYSIYGLTMESSFPFRFRLKTTSAAPDFRFVYHGVVEERKPSGREVSGSCWESDSDQTVMRLFVTDDQETIVFPGIATFECSPDAIHASTYAEGLEYLVEICLVGYVLAYWLERRGTSVIHASAVVVDGRAAAFIAGTSRGKTTTACGFVAAGVPLLTDDTLALEVDADAGPVAIAHPGYPQMKLLPEQLAMLGISPAGFGKVHPLFEKLMVPIGDGIGHYCDRTLPLARIYVLDRIEPDAEPSIIAVPPAAALIELVKHSFAAGLLDAIDRGPTRLGRLATIARVTSMKRLRVPAGYERLPDVRSLVLEDMLTAATVAPGANA